MRWETRNGKPVYYRKVREGGRVRSVYCGSGERGEAAAREDARRRASAPAGRGDDSPPACATAPEGCATAPAEGTVIVFPANSGVPEVSLVAEESPTTAFPSPRADAPRSYYGPLGASPRRHGRPTMTHREAVQLINCILSVNPRRDVEKLIAGLDVDDETRRHLRWKYTRNRP